MFGHDTEMCRGPPTVQPTDHETKLPLIGLLGLLCLLGLLGMIVLIGLLNIELA
jgi:heme A synthase